MTPDSGGWRDSDCSRNRYFFLRYETMPCGWPQRNPPKACYVAADGYHIAAGEGVLKPILSCTGNSFVAVAKPYNATYRPICYQDPYPNTALAGFCPAVIRTPEDLALVEELLTSRWRTVTASFHLGLTNLAGVNSWTWNDGSLLATDSSWWAPGYPTGLCEGFGCNHCAKFFGNFSEGIRIGRCNFLDSSNTGVGANGWYILSNCSTPEPFFVPSPNPSCYTIDNLWMVSYGDDVKNCDNGITYRLEIVTASPVSAVSYTPPAGWCLATWNSSLYPWLLQYRAHVVASSALVNDNPHIVLGVSDISQEGSYLSFVSTDPTNGSSIPSFEPWARAQSYSPNADCVVLDNSGIEDYPCTFQQNMILLQKLLPGQYCVQPPYCYSAYDLLRNNTAAGRPDLPIYYCNGRLYGYLYVNTSYAVNIWNESQPLIDSQAPPGFSGKLASLESQLQKDFLNTITFSNYDNETVFRFVGLFNANNNGVAGYTLGYTPLQLFHINGDPTNYTYTDLSTSQNYGPCYGFRPKPVGSPAIYSYIRGSSCVVPGNTGFGLVVEWTPLPAPAPAPAPEAGPAPAGPPPPPAAVTVALTELSDNSVPAETTSTGSAPSPAASSSLTSTAGLAASSTGINFVNTGTMTVSTTTIYATFQQTNGATLVLLSPAQLEVTSAQLAGTLELHISLQDITDGTVTGEFETVELVLESTTGCQDVSVTQSRTTEGLYLLFSLDSVGCNAALPRGALS